MDNEHKEEHGHDSHSGHGHGEEDVIVLHQEKLLPTLLLATALVIITLFGLAQAGNTKLDIKTGKEAFDKVESEKPVSNVIKKHEQKQPPVSGEGH